jgi:hypothetical protein
MTKVSVSLAAAAWMLGMAGVSVKAFGTPDNVSSRLQVQVSLMRRSRSTIAILSITFIQLRIA